MIKVVFARYRSWAIDVINRVKGHDNIQCIHVITSNEEFQKKKVKFKEEEINLIIFLGWSWIIEDELIDSILCVGIHPSEQAVN